MFTAADVDARAEDEREKLRVRELLVRGAITHTEMDGADFCAVARGTGGAQHRVRVAADLDESTCSCPWYVRGGRGWCKHIAAAALLWIDAPMPCAAAIDTELVGAIELLDVFQARELLLQAAGRSAPLRSRILHDTWSEPPTGAQHLRTKAVPFPIAPARTLPARHGKGAAGARRWPKPEPLVPRRSKRDSGG